MPRKSIGERPMTDAERQARHRAARAAGAPVVRTRRPADHRGRARRWHDAVAELTNSQAHYAAWLEALPANLQDSALRPRCGQSASSTRPRSRQPNRREDLAGSDQSGPWFDPRIGRANQPRCAIRAKPPEGLAGPSRRSSSMQICSGVPMHFLSGVDTFDASRLARNGRNWHHLLRTLCGVVDLDGVSDPVSAE